MNLRTDYSFLFEPLDIITGSCASQLYGFDIVDTVKLGLQDNNQNNNNDNNLVYLEHQKLLTLHLNHQLFDLMDLL